MYDDPSRTKSTIPGGDTRRGSGARRGSVAVQKVMTAAQVLKHDEETDDSEKKWYQKVSWACVGFAVVLFILCAYSWFDVNTVSDEDTEEEKTFSEENGIYVNLVTGIILVFTQVRARARDRDRSRPGLGPEPGPGSGLGLGLGLRSPTPRLPLMR